MMSTKIKSFSDRVFAGAPLHLQYLQHLIPATLQRHIHSCEYIYHMYKDQEGLQAWR